MLNFKNIELKLQLEKMVIGLEEPILIKGGGKFIAKVDSGNAGYNVIHGEDLVQQGDILNFKTFDSDNNERRISKKIVDTLNVHIGAGNIQERPVIELDIKFADEDYKKVPFTVTDRSKNSEKVLISKDFVQNQLDALIDVSQVNMTEKEPVEVDYVNEGLFTGIRNMARAVKRGVNNTTSFLDKVAHGETQFSNTSKIEGKSENENDVNKKISSLKEKVGSDARLVKSTAEQHSDYLDKYLGLKAMDTSVKCKDLYVKRILDYQGNLMYGEKLELPNSIAALYKQKEELLKANSSNNTQQTTSNESFIDRRIKEIYKNYGLIYENSPEPGASPAPAATATQTPAQGEIGQDNKQPGQVSGTALQAPAQQDNAQNNPNQEKINEIDKQINEKISALHEFRLYFVGGTVNGDKVIDNIENKFKEIQAVYISEAKKILNANNEFYMGDGKSFCISIANALKSKNKDGKFVGYFAVVLDDNDCAIYMDNENYFVTGKK